jgi:mRNA export factor
VAQLRDKENKQRLKAMPKCSASIPCAEFNYNGQILAYAVSYDWHKGAEAHNAATATNKIYLHPVAETEVKPRARKTGR